jgi:dCTP deaminase
MIRKLAEPCLMSDLSHGDFVWLDDQPREVLAINADLGVCLREPTGGQRWVDFQGREVTRCGPKGERIVITPFDPQFAGPASYDLHLGDTLLTYAPREAEHFSGQTVLDHVIDPENPSPTVEHKLEEDGRWLLMPGKVYLGATSQYTESHYLRPMLYGRSSIGRLGLFIHVTAGVGDPAFSGRFTLELVATQAIRIRPGMKIGQIAYDTLEGEYLAYKGRYQGDLVPVASRFHI